MLVRIYGIFVILVLILELYSLRNGLIVWNAESAAHRASNLWIIMYKLKNVSQQIMQNGANHVKVN